MADRFSAVFSQAGLRNVFRRRLWWLFFACIVVVNGRYVFEPVYSDMLTGMFVQAFWLAENNLDYFELLQQPGYLEHGPCVYPNAWPTTLLYGGLYYVGVPVKTINFMGHFVVWVSGATILYVVARLLENCRDRPIQVLACLLLFTSPLFQSQTAAFNVEAPLGALSTLAFYYCLRRRYGASLLLSIAALHLHSRGILILLGNGAISAFDVVVGLWLRSQAGGRHVSPQNIDLKRPVNSVLLHGSTLVVFAAFVAAGNNSVSVVGLFAGLGAHPVAYMGIPEFTIAVCTFLFCTVFVFARRVVAVLRDGARSAGPDASEISSLNDSLSDEGIVLRSGVFLLVCVAFFLNVNPILPRYFLMLYPVVAVGLASLLVLEQVSRRIILGVAFVALAWNTLNYQGLCYFPCPSNDGVILERSPEYHTHVELHQRLASYIETRFDLANTVFVTEWPNAHVLAIPAAGYVTSPDIRVYSTSPLPWAKIGSLVEIYRVSGDGEGVEQLSGKRIVWIYSHNGSSAWLEPVYGFKQERRRGLIKVIEVGRRKLEIYERPRFIANADFAEFLAPTPGSRYLALPSATWQARQP